MKSYILRYWWMLLVGEVAVIATGQRVFSRTNSYWDMIAAAKIADVLSLYSCIFVRSRIKRLTFRQAIREFLTEHFLAGAFTGYCLEPFLFWKLPGVVGIAWALFFGKTISDLAFYPLSAACREMFGPEFAKRLKSAIASLARSAKKSFPILAERAGVGAGVLFMTAMISSADAAAIALAILIGAAAGIAIPVFLSVLSAVGQAYLAYDLE